MACDVNDPPIWFVTIDAPNPLSIDTPIRYVTIDSPIRFRHNRPKPFDITIAYRYINLTFPSFHRLL